ncbi:hypothetical protein BKA65DRAFT_494597 [Rhexocercosporidium sp. MPI-PUGE-AT-0058]|nr:hypothetical protein BKA65DRAFT_494597 [Rhexocercosporidium sp. MPI-PUGE-AT-0058]
MAFGLTGRAAARALVEKMAEDHGHISADIFAEMSERAREVVLKSMWKKDQLISSSVITLAKNLYTSKARFVFELLQNADDNHYSRCKASGEVPFIQFSIYQNRIVVDCNEDGFTPENLYAICSIGKSSKKGAQGYIGEKGIGFKSVFMVASRIDIQSGDFSFCFEHQPGEPGLGMISPIWQESTESLPCDTTTRITLHLYDSDGDDPPQIILQQFEDLQVTMLLFLKNIGRVVVSLYDEVEELEKETTYSISPISDQRSRLTKKTTGYSVDDEVKTKDYHVTRHIATNLAQNDNRDYSETEQAERAYSKSEVALAFPLTPDSIPILEKQHIYAFLPVRKEGFDFLIQADWVTQANRQDIVVTSQRNIDLVGGIVDTFAKAVGEFCHHEDLRYTWMRFLPQLTVYPWDGFWKELVQKIISKIQEIPVIVPFDDSPLRLIKNSYRFLPMDLDKNGDPLLEDIWPKVYLSKKYEESDLDKLTQCNLNFVAMTQRVARLRADLARSGSKVKSSTTDKDWHDRLAKALLMCWNRDWVDCQNEWLSARSTVPHLHFPASNGIKIPTDLGLHLLNADTLNSANRMKLFTSLGATEASEEEIKSLIRQRHTSSASLSAAKVKMHVEFLYLTHVKEIKPSAYSHIYFHVANDKYIHRPQTDDVYFIDSQPYGPKELIGQDAEDDKGKKLALFLHDMFAASSYCGSAKGHSLTWIEFLHSCMGIRRRLRLTKRSSFAFGATVSLTPACHYVRQNKAQKLVGLLQYCWIDEENAITASKDILKTIKETEVVCRNGESTEVYKTILPLPKLENLCAQYEEFDCLPFLAFDVPLKDSHLSMWMFLKDHFGVTVDDNVYFYLEVLKAIAGSSASENVFDLFETIYTKWKQATDNDGNKSKIRELLDNDKALAIPIPVGNCTYDEVFGPTTRTVAWSIPMSTTWDGPDEMMWNTPIKARFESASIAMNPVLEAFYRDLAGVRNYTLDDLMEEIRAFRDCCSQDPKHNQERISKTTRKIYMHIPQFMEEEEDKEDLRQMFDSEALIWKLVGGKTQWYKLSDCIWSGSTEIPGKAMLSDQWGDMKEVFVNLLKIPTLSFNMVYEKLKKIGTSPQTGVTEAKETLEALNSFLTVGEGRHSDPRDALDARVFPIRQPQGNVVLVSATVQFAIPDRQHWAEAFRDKVRMLDLSLSEIQRLQPFLKWTGLESRYLSLTVKEGSDISRAGCMPLHDPRKEIPPKAHALYRIAKHFDSPRIQSANHNLYDTFRNTSLWTANRIFTTLELAQDGESHYFEVPDQNGGKVHIEDDLPIGLRIYVPRDARAQEISYLSALQRRLLGWIMTPPSSSTPSNCLNPAALSILKSVLIAHRFTLESSLEEEGIGIVDFEDDFEEEIDADSTFQARNLRPSTPTSNLHSLSPDALESSSPSESGSETLIQHTPASSLSSSSNSGEVHIREHNDFSFSSRLSYSSGNPFIISSRSRPVAHPLELDIGEADLSDPVDVPDTEYVRILCMAISKARAAKLPESYSLNVTALDSNGEDASRRIKCRSPFELTCKIGAAGELFAFVFLSHLLPDFTRNNWPSTMRRYVRAHPDYAGLEPWTGRETSDITYNDTEGKLVQKLIECGYLESAWSNVRGNFFIEVKTTTGPCQQPFFMSDRQYHRMQNSSDTGLFPSRENVYILFRVFNLGKDTMDFRIFVDPEKHRQQGTLKFSCNWTVVPGSSPTSEAV